MLQVEGDTGPFLMYTYARLCSLEENSGITVRQRKRPGGHWQRSSALLDFDGNLVSVVVDPSSRFVRLLSLAWLPILATPSLDSSVMRVLWFCVYLVDSWMQMLRRCY